jgi:hypothetical protein
MGKCQYYNVETQFVKGKTDTPIIEKTCTHPNIVQLFGMEGIGKITCEGDDKRCLLSNKQKYIT